MFVKSLRNIWGKVHNVLLAIMAKVGYNYEHEDGHPVLDKKS